MMIPPLAESEAETGVHRLPSILITGCSSGIGYHAAHTLQRLGWQVFAACRREADVARLTGEGLVSLRLDYSDSASIEAALATVLNATGGRLDALFNNGAYAHPAAIEDLATADLRALLEADFIGWHDLTRRVIPAMRRQGSGRIVNCSSVLGVVAGRFTGAYVAAKFAVEGWSDTLRLELAGSGISVSLIEPGPIATRFLEHAREHFVASVDPKGSPFREDYDRALARLTEDHPGSMFERGPEAVTSALLRALQSRRPRARYPVTLPAHIGLWSKRLLPTRVLDWFLLLQR
jgi:NAD(P)-dependent dehydrogenase (short-subunit alcohol dehydrogenase family)